jgi:hypothetical protein
LRLKILPLRDESVREVRVVILNWLSVLPRTPRTNLTAAQAENAKKQRFFQKDSSATRINCLL